MRALKGALDGASQAVNIRLKRGCSSGVFEPSRCSCMLTDGNRLRPAIATPRMHQTGSGRKNRYTLTCLSKNKLLNNAFFFQEIAEVESLCFCVSETLQWGLIWQWENTTASFVNIRRQDRTVFSSVCSCKNPLSLSKECVSVGLHTCVIPTGPIVYVKLHFIPCCFAIQKLLSLSPSMCPHTH